MPSRRSRPSGPSSISSKFGICFTRTAIRIRCEVMAREAVIVDLRPAPRSASARARWPAGTRPICSGLVLRTIVERNDIDPARIDDVVGGCVTQSGEQGCNVTRNAWVAGGLPWHVPATSVDRQCGSSQQAAHFVAQGVIAGAYDIGDRVRRRVDDPRADVVERARRHRAVQRRVPRATRTTRSASSSGSRRCSPTSGASRARRWTSTRCSRTGAAAANTDNGFFAGEIVPVPINDPETGERTGAVLSADEGIRRDASLEKIAALAARVGVRGPARARHHRRQLVADDRRRVGDDHRVGRLRRAARPAGPGPLRHFAVAAEDPVLVLSRPSP